jgi:hypothetical protein
MCIIWDSTMSSSPQRAARLGFLPDAAATTHTHTPAPKKRTRRMQLAVNDQVPKAAGGLGGKALYIGGCQIGGDGVLKQQGPTQPAGSVVTEACWLTRPACQARELYACE